MISSISSARVWTPQPTSTTSQSSSGDLGGNASGSSVASLSSLFYADTSEEDDDYGYAADISMASQPQTTTGDMADADGDGSIDDMSSNAFMKALSQKIDTLEASDDTKDMAVAMREALSAGRLTVTDVTAGEQITGREPTSLAVASSGSAPAASSDDVTTVATSEWSTFLRDTLLRDSHGLYVRNEDSSHIDKVTGASAYFGMIGDDNYYLSWTMTADA